MISQRYGKYQMILGLVTVLVTFWGTILYIAPFYTHTYPFAWYGLILFLDGWLWWRWDESLLVKRRLEFVSLLFWSAVFWFFFELWNLRLRNWYYVGTSPNAIWAHGEAYLDFATVLPGMFLVYRLLVRLDFPRPFKTRFHLSKNWRHIFPWIGVAMVVLPLSFPAYFYPLVWGAFFFLLEPLCAARGAPSLMKNAEKGDWTILLRLLVSGLICGAYWEFCNYWAQAKWIYTVPLFSQGKLFEMPYLGFVGFAPFCVECFVMTNAVFLLRNGKHWDQTFSQRTASHSVPKTIYLCVVVSGIVLSEWSYSQLKYHTIDSVGETASQVVSDISPRDAETLVQKGYQFPAQVLKDWSTVRTAIGSDHTTAIHNRLTLSSHLQMGSANARLLESVGVFTVERLGKQDPDVLFPRMLKSEEKNAFRKRPLLKRRVMAWIQGAKRRHIFY